MSKTLLERVEAAQKMIDQQALSFGKVIIDNLDKKDFANVTEFKNWYLKAISEDDGSSNKPIQIDSNSNEF